MKLIVEKYDPITMCHICTDESGCRRKVDLFVNGDLTPLGYSFAGIIGKTVEVSSLEMSLEMSIDLGMNVKVLEPEEQENENEQ